MNGYLNIASQVFNFFYTRLELLNHSVDSYADEKELGTQANREVVVAEEF
jgi:hypothetical protein